MNVNTPAVSYAYDLAGHRLAAGTTGPALALPSGAALSFATSTSYDALNRPVAVSWSPAAAQVLPAPGSATFTYAYDATNRRVSDAAGCSRNPSSAGVLYGGTRPCPCMGAAVHA